jgi:hypothetical protein
VEIKKLEAEINQINVMTQLEDEKVDIQAANTVLGREKVKAQNRQIDVAEKKLKSDEKLKRAELRQKKQESANGKPTKPTGKG